MSEYQAGVIVKVFPREDEACSVLFCKMIYKAAWIGMSDWYAYIPERSKGI